MLIKSGADVNSARDDGETAVHMAARMGNLKTFKLLLQEGGDSRTQSKVKASLSVREVLDSIPGTVKSDSVANGSPSLRRIFGAVLLRR